MGCYDTVKITCPKCHKTFSIQSKAGKCRLRTYKLEKAPLPILANLQEEIIFCEFCHATIDIDIQYIVRIS